MILHTVMPLARWLHTKTRRRIVLLMAWVITYVIAAGPAQAAMAGKTSPDGIGGLFTIPNLRGGQAPLLVEAYGPSHYVLYNDLGWTDVVDKVAYPIYEALEEISYAIVKLAVGLTWWLHDMSTFDSGTQAIARGVQSTAASMQDWMLPTAIAVGALIAYVRARQGGSDVLGQVLAVAVAAVTVIGLAQSAPNIIGGLDRGRVVVAETVNGLGAGAISQQNEPFRFSKDPHLNPGSPNVVERKSGDVVWREFYVTPWCQAQFGSQEACKQYGDGWLAQPNNDARKNYLDHHIADSEGGDGSATVDFIKGKAPGSRIGTAILGLVIAVGGAVVIGGLAFFALMPWLLALILLYLAVFFLCLAVIPGRPRQIGIDFISSILGLTLFSALIGGLLSAMLLMMIQASKLSGTKGWLAAMLFTTGVLMATWEARKMMNRMLTGSAGSGGGMGAMLGTLAMARMGSRMLGNVGRRAGYGRRRYSGGGAPTERPAPPAGAQSGGPGRGEGVAYRSGQLAGAARHPSIAARKGANRSGQFFKARGHAAAGAVTGRAARLRDATARGYASTGRRDAAPARPVDRERVKGAPTRPAGRHEGSRKQQRPSGDRGSTSRNTPPTKVSHQTPASRHPAGVYAHGWTPKAGPQQDGSASPATRGEHHAPTPQPAYANASTGGGRYTRQARQGGSPRPATPPAQRPARPEQPPRAAGKKATTTPKPRPGKRTRKPKGEDR